MIKHKMKKITTALLSIIMILSLLCACGDSSKSSEETTAQKLNYEIKAEIIDAYDMGDEEIKIANDFFEDLEKAFSDLIEGDELTDADFAEYASSVEEITSEFNNSIDWGVVNDKVSNETDADKKEALILISSKHASLRSSHSSLTMANFNYFVGDGSAESCAEEAFNVVNEYALFFLDEALIADEDLDNLG